MGARANRPAAGAVRTCNQASEVVGRGWRGRLLQGAPCRRFERAALAGISGPRKTCCLRERGRARVALPRAMSAGILFRSGALRWNRGFRPRCSNTSPVRRREKGGIGPDIAVVAVERGRSGARRRYPFQPAPRRGGSVLSQGVSLDRRAAITVAPMVRRSCVRSIPTAGSPTQDRPS